MTPMTDETFVEHGGSRCPVCHSHNILANPMEVDAGTAWAGVDCLDCGAEWHEIYNLVGYSLITDGNKP